MLYPFVEHNHAAAIVLQAIFDGPIDNLSIGEQPVILKKLPTVDNQGIMVLPIDVKKGSKVIDAYGLPTTLEPGTTVFPSGCHDISCSETFSTGSSLQMDQIVISFEVLPGVEWSNGDALTSADFLFGYELAKSESGSKVQYISERTQAYEQTDEMNFQWWGLPGYLNTDPAMILVQPMASKAMAGSDTTNLVSDYGYNVMPIVWGPYQFDVWEPGKYIRLSKNKNYFRASEGLPQFDTIIFQFYDSPQQALADFIDGRCDLVDTSVHAESELPLLTQLQASGSLKIQVSSSPILESLHLRIGKQASTPVGGTLQEFDPLANRDMRIAIEQCIDRQQLADRLFNGQAELATSYLPQYRSNSATDTNNFQYDQKRTSEILQGVGWKDPDNNPKTPRISVGVQGIPDGKELILRYVSLDTPFRRKLGQLLSNQLSACGIGLDEHYLSAVDFYQTGAESPLYGRNFDILDVSTGTYGNIDTCVQYSSDQAPSVTNGWEGMNFSGFSNPDFDLACNQSVNDAGITAISASASENAQKIFSNEVPVIPLFWRPKMLVSIPSLCMPDIDPAAENDLWNLESYRLGSDCAPSE